MFRRGEEPRDTASEVVITQPTSKTEIKAQNTMGVNTRQMVEIPGMEDENERYRGNIEILQDLSVWTRTKWAAADHKKLRERIQDIKDANRELKNLLRLRSVREPTMFLLTDLETEPPLYMSENTIHQLSNLHKSLKVLNIRRSGKDSYPLSIQLREDNDASRKELANAEGVVLRDNTIVFNLQRHESFKALNYPTTLAVECFPVTTKARQTLEGLDKLQSLEGPSTAKYLSPVAQGLEIETWGYFEGYSSDWHYVLFYDTISKWSTSVTLAEIVDDAQFCQHISPLQIIQLSRLIAFSYLYHSEIRSSCRDPRLEDFRYYRSAEDSLEWDDEDPLILRP